MKQSLRLVLVVAGLAFFTGCPSCAPGKVGPGAARLTIRNVGAMATLLNADTSCGFSATSVLSNPTVTGNVGGMGTVTYQATDCVIDSGEGKEVSKSCENVVTTSSGKVTLTAKRTVTGQLTGNPMNPVIPAGPDAVTITLEKATFDNFKVVVSSSENKMTMIKGNLTATLKPRLAVNSTNGACSIATPNTSFADVKYDAASEAFIDTPSNAFGVTIDSSNLAAQNGVNGDKTNALSGLITVFGKEVDAAPAEGGLDPDYNQESFDKGWQCNPALAMPVSYMCADLKPRLAGGVARLTVRTIGTVASIVDKNTMCGFSSPAVGGTPALTGTVGKSDGQAVFTIGTPCVITLPADTLLSTDCNMVTTKGGGKVTVTGTKTVRGFRTGNPLQPIVPTTPEPALFDLTLVFENFELKKSDSTSSLLIKTGGFSGKVSPRTAIDSTTGACSISTPVAGFTDMSWTAGSTVQLTTDGNKFDLGVGASMLTAQNGNKSPTATNVISGTITVDGMPYQLAAGGEPLDTAFVQATFDASFACTPNIVVPSTVTADLACSFRQALGIGAARLLVKSFATATSAVNGNAMCGFSAPAVLGAPTNVTGAAGMPGSITWSINACAIGPLPANTTIQTNCLGNPTKAGGTVTLTGTKTVQGLRGMNPPIIPLARDAGTFDMTNVTFAAFELFELPNDGGMTASSKSTVTGMGSVVVRPIGGEADAGIGTPVYSLTTPVAAIDNLTMASGTMILVSNGSQFEVALTNVSLNAYNGSQFGKSNALSGSLTVDGQPVTIAPNTPLDPAFNQMRFDQAYACTPGLQTVVPP